MSLSTFGKKVVKVGFELELHLLIIDTDIFIIVDIIDIIIDIIDIIDFIDFIIDYYIIIDIIDIIDFIDIIDINVILFMFIIDYY